jgi:hypothetical protein
MFAGQDLAALVTLLARRDASIFHACQLRDFRSYLDLGGVPSRGLMSESGKWFTRFETDSADRRNGVWELVFANLSDFGEMFANGPVGTVPNPYGPIQIQLRAKALSLADDVAICLKSAGASEFNRERECLSDLAAVDRLFRYPADVGFPESTRVWFATELQELFGAGSTNPEISCRYSGQLLRVEDAAAIIVDPYVIDGTSLVSLVRQLAGGLACHIAERAPASRWRYADVLKGVREQSPLGRLQQETGWVREWAGQVSSSGLEHQYRRFATYLRAGTLVEFGS